MIQHTDIRTPPSIIEVMLHCYYSPEPVPRLYTTDSVRRAVDWLRTQGLLTLTSEIDVFDTTPKGRAWVEMICHTPLPVQIRTWVDPRTEQEVATHHRKVDSHE